MSPTDNQDDLDAAQDRARRDHESREQVADDRCSEPHPEHCVCNTEAERQKCQHACEYLESWDQSDEA